VLSSCTEGGLIKLTCLFHSSQLSVTLKLFCGAVGCSMSNDLCPWLVCLPSVDFYWGVCLLGSSNPYRPRLSTCLSVGSILMPGGRIAFFLLFSHSYIVRVGSDHLCCFPYWLSVGQSYFALCPFSQFPQCSSEISWQAWQCHPSVGQVSWLW
jgi:hypothetical protein